MDGSGDGSGGLSRKEKKKQREREKKRQQKEVEAAGVALLPKAPLASAAADTSSVTPTAVPSSSSSSSSTTTTTTTIKTTKSTATTTKIGDSVSSRSSGDNSEEALAPIEFVDYVDERQLPEIMALVDADLSEPYSVFTYRFFLARWPELCICAMRQGVLVGVVICKAEREPDRFGEDALRGYVAMLAVSSTCRRRGIGSSLVRQAVGRMLDAGCDEAMLETEVTNRESLRLYGRLGFVRDERLVRYYLNGVDAFRLKLWFPVELREASKAAREARAAEAAGATEATEAAAGELT